MSIDPEARKQADEWFRQNQQSAAQNISICPNYLTPDQKQDFLAISKPEYYGRLARTIRSVILGSFEKRESRQPLGFVTWRGDIVNPATITAINDFSEAFYATLVIDLQGYLEKIHTFDPEEDEAVAEFNEFISLRALLKYRATLRQYGFGDPKEDLEAGIGTATFHIGKLLPVMATYLNSLGVTETNAYEIIHNSFKPIMRLASIDAKQLLDFDDEILSQKEAQDLFILTTRNSLDFSTSTLAKIQAFPVMHGPTIGCPVLFDHTATPNLWQWGVESANRCGLLKPGLYQ